jgi:hypothetical protein
MARSWGIPPWQIEHPDRPPSEAEVSQWYWREETVRRLGLDRLED